MNRQERSSGRRSGHRPASRRLRFTLVSLALLLALGGCQSFLGSWQTSITTPDGTIFRVDRDRLRDLEEFSREDGAVPLEVVLWQAGHRLIHELILVDTEDSTHQWDWPSVAGQAWWYQDGAIAIDSDEFTASQLEALPSPLQDRVEVGIVDIAPTVAAVLGLRQPSDSTGRRLSAPAADNVMLLFLDGFGYMRYLEALQDGLIPNLSGFGEPLLGLTEYPPSTRVGTASLLTGAPPDVTGVNSRSIRSTESETLFDVAAEAGLSVAAVEGDALAFNLRSSNLQLSGDRDGNGSTDDNVLGNALAVLAEGMPDLFYVHFHGIDDAGHSFGPGANAEEESIRGVDQAVGELLGAVPEGTLAIIFADHGMHSVQEEGRSGGHSHLIDRDMLIPIILTTK